jgi:hypothetical protein
MRRPVGLDPDQRWRQLGKELDDLGAVQALLEHDLPKSLAVHLEHGLRDVEPDRGSVQGGRSSCWS